MTAKLAGEMEKITVIGISLKELQFGGFSTPPKMETTCVPEKCRRHNSLKALFAVYTSTIATLAGEMEKITGFGIFFGIILIGLTHFNWRAPIDVHPAHMQKLLPWFWVSGVFYLAFLYILRSFNKVCLGWCSPSLLKHSPNRLNGRGCFTSGAKHF